MSSVTIAVAGTLINFDEKSLNHYVFVLGSSPASKLTNWPTLLTTKHFSVFSNLEKRSVSLLKTISWFRESFKNYLIIEKSLNLRDPCTVC